MSDLFNWASEREPVYPADIPEDVCKLFEDLAIKIRAKGWARYSSDALLHRIRWEFHVERGDREFKANNNWTAPLARWFLKRHPDMAGFFETRERKPKGDEHGESSEQRA